MPENPSRGRGSVLGALLALLFLSGCASMPSWGFGATAGKARATRASAPPAPPEALQERPEPHGLLAFVARASPGQSRIFEDAAKGAVRVRMGRQYYSADGVVCRHFTLAPLAPSAANESETRAVCREARGWRLDPIGSTGALALDR
jgi:hypothetical protein